MRIIHRSAFCVPQPFLAKTKRKIEAAREGWGHLTGIISTRDKFEAHKLRMAERVWAEMDANGSRECRSCHNFATMDFDEQGRMGGRGGAFGLGRAGPRGDS